MATTSETVSRWARGFVAAGACWLVVWQGAALAGAGRRVEVTLAVLGFALHVVFGKAYSLVPSYFDRELSFARAPAVHLPLAVAGTAGLALEGIPGPPVGAAGAVLWAGGVAVFLGTVGWTVRDNPTGAETGTGEHNADRRTVDRTANAFVPVALLYLAVGSYGLVAVRTGLPSPVASGAALSHLLAAGTAAVFVFAVGFRLLPRFLVASPPTPLVAVVLPAGAAGPALIAAGIGGGPLRVGAVVEAVAVAGYALAYLHLFRASDRDRVGFYGVLAGALAGVLAVGLGLWFAFVGPDARLAVAHYRLTLLGFLGLTIVGVAYQFYPPSVARFPGGGDRSGFASIGCLGGGLLVAAAGLAAGNAAAVLVGEALGLAGALLFAYLVVGLFVQRARG